MSSKIIPAKVYNEDIRNDGFYAFTGSKKRQTGYVVIHADNERRWYPNIQQAKTEVKFPGMWPDRGEIIYIP